MAVSPENAMYAHRCRMPRRRPSMTMKAHPATAMMSRSIVSELTAGPLPNQSPKKSVRSMMAMTL